MKKAILIAALLLSVLFLFAGCGEKKVLHCDFCGKEITVPASSNMEEDWILACTDCEKEQGLDKIVEER